MENDMTASRVEPTVMPTTYAEVVANGIWDDAAAFAEEYYVSAYFAADHVAYVMAQTKKRIPKCDKLYGLPVKYRTDYIFKVRVDSAYEAINSKIDECRVICEKMQELRTRVHLREDKLAHVHVMRICELYLEWYAKRREVIQIESSDQYMRDDYEMRSYSTVR